MHFHQRRSLITGLYTEAPWAAAPPVITTAFPPVIDDSGSDNAVTASSASTGSQGAPPTAPPHAGFKIIYLVPLFVLAALCLLLAIAGKAWGWYMRTSRKQAMGEPRMDEEAPLQRNYPTTRSRHVGKWQADLQSNSWWTVHARRALERDEDEDEQRAQPVWGRIKQSVSGIVTSTSHFTGQQQHGAERGRPTPTNSYIHLEATPGIHNHVDWDPSPLRAAAKLSSMRNIVSASWVSLSGLRVKRDHTVNVETGEEEEAGETHTVLPTPRQSSHDTLSSYPEDSPHFSDAPTEHLLDDEHPATTSSPSKRPGSSYYPDTERTTTPPHEGETPRRWRPTHISSTPRGAASPLKKAAAEAPIGLTRAHTLRAAAGEEAGVRRSATATHVSRAGDEAGARGSHRLTASRTLPALALERASVEEALDSSVGSVDEEQHGSSSPSPELRNPYQDEWPPASGTIVFLDANEGEGSDDARAMQASTSFEGTEGARLRREGQGMTTSVSLRALQSALVRRGTKQAPHVEAPHVEVSHVEVSHVEASVVPAPRPSTPPSRRAHAHASSPCGSPARTPRARQRTWQQRNGRWQRLETDAAAEAATADRASPTPRARERDVLAGLASPPPAVRLEDIFATPGAGAAGGALFEDAGQQGLQASPVRRTALRPPRRYQAPLDARAGSEEHTARSSPALREKERREALERVQSVLRQGWKRRGELDGDEEDEEGV